MNPIKSKRYNGAKAVLWGLLLCGTAAAQVTLPGVTEPVLGLVFDAGTNSVRAIRGIAAVSRVAETLEGTPGTTIAISSDQLYALALEEGTGAAILVSQSGQRPLPGIRPGALRAALSPRGTAAAVYFADTGKASILTGLPDSPQTAGEVTLDGQPSMLAVSDDGANLAAVVNLSAGEATVYSYSAGGAGQVLLRDRRFPSLEFVPGSAKLLLATEAAVYLYQGSLGLQLLADERDGIAGVVGAAASGDGKRIFIGMQSGQVAVRDLGASTQTLLSCDCQPAGMWRLRGKAVFRLNDLGTGPLWVVDGDSMEPRILFVAMPAGENR